MMSMPRKFVLSLLLLLVLCNAAFVAHAASHQSGDIVKCKLCLAHTPLSHGLANTDSNQPVAYGVTIAVELSSNFIATSNVQTSFARGPPRPIQ